MKESGQGYITAEKHRANIARVIDRFTGKTAIRDTWLLRGEQAFKQREYLSGLRKRITTAQRCYEAMR